MRAMFDPKVANYGSICIGPPSLRQIWNLSPDKHWNRGKLAGQCAMHLIREAASTNQLQDLLYASRILDEFH